MLQTTAAVIFCALIGYDCIQAQNAYTGFLDTIARTRTALRDLELDSLQLSMPFGNKDVANVKFYLYTGKNPSLGQELRLNDTETFTKSNFDISKPTKILIHGYTQSLISLDFPQKIKDAYLEQAKVSTGRRGRRGGQHYNIICVDWSVLSKEIVYFDSAEYTKEVGKRIGEFLHFMKISDFLSTYRSVHIVGFSLGAHVAGIAGHYVQNATDADEKIGRITGLDPAGPYPLEPLTERLDKEDALFVDVVHTNAGSLLLGDLGTTTVSGHADFYPGGGRRQSGCEYALFTEYSIPRRSTCSHLKAAEYFGKSILSPKKYIACQCETWEAFTSGSCGCPKNRTTLNTAVMGEYVSPLSKGKYYLYAK